MKSCSRYWFFGVLAAGLIFARVGRAGPFALQGPGVNASDFRITVFATNLYYPLGMAQLSDGSMMVAVSQGTSFWNSVGQIIRLTDTNQDGVADGPGTVLYTGLPGTQSSLRLWSNLVFVITPQIGQPISILRLGANPAAPLTLVGQISINYPSGGWEHTASGLGIRPTPGQPQSCDLFFQLGSDQNFAKTTRTVTISSAQIPGASGTLQGESIYRLTFTDNLTNVTATNLTRIAQGLRNPTGFIFHPLTGDLYFVDNGIDGLVNGNEPLSADELNFIVADQIGNGAPPDFGYPSNYTEYRTGKLIGGAGVQPLFNFEPLPDPFTGSESEGPNEVAFSPPGFPLALNNGMFIGFHGRWDLAGITNEENPLVFADLSTTNYFQFIGNDWPNIGHLDGLMPTFDSLFLADLTSAGNMTTGGNAGVIYQIKSLVARLLSCRLQSNSLQFNWSRGGALLQSSNLAGPWNNLAAGTNAFSLTVDPGQTRSFYRVQY